MFAAKKTKRNVGLKKVNPINDKVIITKGKNINGILFSFKKVEFDLFKKKGHVAPKCVSAKISTVKNIKYSSNSGAIYKIKQYIKGNIIGNFTNKNSVFILFVIILIKLKIY